MGVADTEIGFPLGLVDFLDSWQRTLRAYCRETIIDGLPSTLIDGENFYLRLPLISAIYFLRYERPRSRVLYVGRASNLRRRWTTQYYIADPKRRCESLCHHQLERCLAEGNVAIHWLEMPRELPRRGRGSHDRDKHKPRWNSCRA